MAYTIIKNPDGTYAIKKKDKKKDTKKKVVPLSQRVIAERVAAERG